MTYYKFFNKLLGAPATYIMIDGIRILVEGTILAGQFERVEEDKDSFIDDEELTNIIQSRLSKSQDSNQLVFGQQDNFLPIAALRTLIAKGLRCSSAVCRLVRNYATDSGIDEILETIVYGIHTGFYSREDINNILSIKPSEDFWDEYDQISETIKPTKIIESLHKNTNFIDKLKAKVGKLPVGTGFLVGQNYLLTNHHILPTQDILKDFTAQFLYEQDGLGVKIKEPIEYQLDESFFVTCQENKKLDYTLVKLKPLERLDDDSITHEKRNKYNLIFDYAGDNFGWLAMCEESRLIAPPYYINRTTKTIKARDKSVYKGDKKSDFYDIPGEPAIIIQHPRGKDKEIVMFNNRVQKVYKDFIQYETSTLPGSSGSAVLTQNWNLVGLHHATLIDDENNYVVGHLGVKICKIIKDLQEQSKEETEFSQGLSNFIERYIVLNNKSIVRGRIFLVANYVTRYKEKEPTDKVKEICERVITKLTQLEEKETHSFKVIKVPDDLENSQKVIEWIEKYDEYQVGDIALQIYISERKTEYERGVTIFHVANKDERRLHAELLLQSLTNIIPELPSQGARSDSSAGKDGIDFCRKLRMPSLRMRLGFWHNNDDKNDDKNDDWNIINEHSDDMASVLTQGLLAWGDSLSPIPVLPKF